MKDQSLSESLGGIRFLHDFSQEHVDLIANVARLRGFNESSIVFREGEEADHIYLVLSGKVSLEICAPGVGCRRILTVGPGEILGWSALLDESRMTATARTLEATQLVALDASDLRSSFERDPKFGYEFTRLAMHAIAKRLSATRMQLLNVFGSELPAAAVANED